MHEKGKRATDVDEENQISEAGNSGDRYGRIQRLPISNMVEAVGRILICTREAIRTRTRAAAKC